ncbi:MAG: hypothetical protein NVS9B4_14600 [Candidatus Acidiferrum sp.]
MSRRAALLLVLGLLQIIGVLVHAPVLKGIASATNASPAPKVFSSVDGLETFSSEFYIEWMDRPGVLHSLKLTPDVYALVKGPYNRRNVFGAALAYAPVLEKDPHTKEMFESVVHYALCGRAPLLQEVGIDPATLQGSASIRLVPRRGTPFGNQPFLIRPACP